MSRIILSINAGSSSVKVSVYTCDSGSSSPAPNSVASVSLSGLTAPPTILTKTDKSTETLENVSSPQKAFAAILKHLTEDASLRELQHPDDITFACHRIVHGGEFSTPTRIDQDTYQRLESLSDLAPLHNAGALEIVKAVHSSIPKCTNVAFFDSAFHATIPTTVRTYMIDQTKARKTGLRKYGFHGLSYAFITRSVAAHLSKPASEIALIALHLGSGASICAIRGGKSLDTSMGLTPLSGLPGATRSGDVDPSLIFHFTHDAARPSPATSTAMHVTQAEMILNKESGWKALTGTTDFGEVSKRAEAGDEMASLAFDVFVDRLVSFIGSYFVKLEGKVDALVFAGGIGEHGVLLRKIVVERVKCLGFRLDEAANEKLEKGEVVDIGVEREEKFRVLVCQTDEQTEMARQCAEDAESLQRPT